MNEEAMTAAALDDLTRRHPALAACRGQIRDAYAMLAAACAAGGTIFVCGNGGSRADADHIVGELSKGFLSKRPLAPETVRAFSARLGTDADHLCARLQRGLRAMLLDAHPALTTAYFNDVDPLMACAQQLFVMARPGDAVIGISTSGNAANVANVFKVAAGMGVRRLLLTGNRHGACEALAELSIAVPEAETYKIQELHLPVYHALCIMLEKRFFGDGD